MHSAARSRPLGASTTARWPRFEAQYAALGLPPPVVPFKPPPQKQLDKQLEKELEKAAKDIRAESPLIADDERSVVIPGHLATQDVEEDGGAAAEDAKEKLASERFDVGDRRLRAQLQRGERPDARGPDQGRADRVPASRDHAPRRLPGRDRRGDPAGDRRRLDPRDALRAADHGRAGRHLAVRAQHRDRAEPGPGRGLRAADGLPLPRGARARRGDPGGAPAHGRDRGQDRPLLGPHRRGGDDRADRLPAALPLLGRRGGRDRGDPRLAW